MSALELFTRGDWSIRAGFVGGQAVFVARDVCAAVDIAKPRDAVARLDEDERVSMIVDTPGGPQSMTAVTQPGLLRLMMNGRSEGAKGFQRWVLHEVLPAVLKSGTYSATPAPALPSYPEALRQLAAEIERTAELQAELEEAAPKAAMADAVLAADGDLSLREAAQALTRDHGIEIGQNRLMAKLREFGWVDLRGTPYQRHIGRGVIAVRVRTYDHPHTGESTIATQIRVTPKGLTELHRLLRPAPAPQLALVPGGAS